MVVIWNRVKKAKKHAENAQKGAKKCLDEIVCSVEKDYDEAKGNSEKQKKV